MNLEVVVEPVKMWRKTELTESKRKKVIKTCYLK